jgi:hypothetical protein
MWPFRRRRRGSPLSWTDGESRVEKAALIGAVPPLMVKTAANWLSPNRSGRMFAKIKNSLKALRRKKPRTVARPRRIFTGFRPRITVRTGPANCQQSLWFPARIRIVSARASLVVFGGICPMPPTTISKNVVRSTTCGQHGLEIIS